MDLIDTDKKGFIDIRMLCRVSYICVFSICTNTIHVVFSRQCLAPERVYVAW